MTTSEAPSKKFKIARIIGRLNIGGPARQACYLHENLAEKFDTVLIAGRIDTHEGDMSYLLTSNKGVYWIGSMSRPVRLFSDLASAWAIFRILRKERPDLVHTHTAKAGAVGRFAAVLARVPKIVHTYHGNVFRGYFSPFKTWVYIKIERMLNRFTTRVIAISDSQASELAEEYKVVARRKVRVVPIGFEFPPVPHAEERMAARESLGLTQNQVAVLWAGRFAPIKNVDLLIETIERTHAEVPNLHFLIAGDGEERDKFSRLEGKSNFTRLGWQTDLARYYAACDIVLLTSNNEGTPATLIEGMAAARPFVSTNVGGVKDLASPPIEASNAGGQQAQNGFLVSGEASSIVSCLQQLAASPALREAMGQAGRTFVTHRHSAERLSENIETLYIELLQP